MKTNFTSYDIVCMITELQSLIGMRVNQIYDIDSKTYLIRLQRGEEKSVLLLESGTRFHLTAFEWPKNVAPSGFTIKMRKHLKNKRLEKLEQVGVDRVVDLQFGSGEAAYHIILELYDRGNIVLTDYQLTIMNILRPHVEGEEFSLAVREKYPFSRLKLDGQVPTNDQLLDLIKVSRPGDKLQAILTYYLNCGPTVVRHVLLKHQISNRQIPGSTVGDPKDKKKKKKGDDAEAGVDFDIEKDMGTLQNAISEAHQMMEEAKINKPKGFIVLKAEAKPKGFGTEEEEIFHSNVEYHPLIFLQNKDKPHKEFDVFNTAVDEFYSLQESQKIDLKAIHQEKEALKKLSNVKKDHTKRLDELSKTQKLDAKKAELITRNQQLVENAIYAIRSSLASQMSWPDIEDLVKSAQSNRDPVASSIRKLKLEINHISLYLTDPYTGGFDESDDDDEEREEDEDKLLPMVIDVDLELSAYANARKYHDQRRYAAKKEMKTIESSGKALKSAEKRTQQALKEVKTMTSIQKARKVYWFEKFYWFISSENFLVISGRDQQQNELIVKRYMRATDIYVHADIQGASSVIIRNPSGNEVPPKTLLEAGAMAISYSIAWDAKVVTSAYWVKSDQVSKTAPTGEYLSTGSFMIRGKKNFLPPCHLILGLSFLFKLEDSSIERHKGERRVRNFNDDPQFEKLTIVTEPAEQEIIEEENEIELGNSESENEDEDQLVDDEKSEKLADISEHDDSEPDDMEPTTSVEFPDTQIKIEHDTGKITVKSDPSKLVRFNSQVEEENENVIFLGDDKPYIIQPKLPRAKQQQQSKAAKHQNKNQNQKDREVVVAAAAAAANEIKEQQQQSQNKRGQKGKLKKIKEKYKDQDEEERKLRMEILKSSGEGKPKKVKGSKKHSGFEPKKVPGKKFEPKPKEGDGEDDDVTPANADVDMLDSLTGIPHEEDELLFAIPVIAPYQTLQNYKFKVKLTPGSGRRGKASKMAVQIFLKDKACSQREKDLIKNVREDLMARNIPGKVKLSAPQIQKIYK